MKRFALLLILVVPASALADDVGQIWKSKCKSCHGDDGQPTSTGKKSKTPDISTAEWHAKWTDAKIQAVIADGSPDNDKMKPFKEKLAEAEITGLVKHIRTMKK